MKMAGTLALKHLWQYAAVEAKPKGESLAWVINSVYHPAKMNYHLVIQCRIFSSSFFALVQIIN